MLLSALDHKASNQQNTLVQGLNGRDNPTLRSKLGRNKSENVIGAINVALTRLPFWPRHPVSRVIVTGCILSFFLFPLLGMMTTKARTHSDFQVLRVGR
jgi:hypothetical protein